MMAETADAERIAQIHMSAFCSNALIRAIYPTEEVRTGLAQAVEWKVRDDIQDANISVLIVRNVSGPASKSEIIGFATWTHPIESDISYTPSPWRLPQGTDWEVLTPWKTLVEEAEDIVVGCMPHYGQ